MPFAMSLTTRFSTKLFAIEVLISICFLAPAQRVFAQTCPAHKIVIPFINGVFVTKLSAHSDVETLRSAICANPSDTSVCQNGDFEELYNASGLNDLPSDKVTLSNILSAIQDSWRDIIETLWQIANENGRQAPAWYDYLLYIFMNPGNQSVLDVQATDVLYGAANPPTQAKIAGMSAALNNCTTLGTTSCWWCSRRAICSPTLCTTRSPPCTGGNTLAHMTSHRQRPCCQDNTRSTPWTLSSSWQDWQLTSSTQVSRRRHRIARNSARMTGLAIA